MCGELAFLERVSAEFRLWVGRMPDNHHELMSAVVGRCREDGADARIVGGAGPCRADRVGVPSSDVMHDSARAVLVVFAQIGRPVRSADEMLGGEIAVLRRSADVGHPRDPHGFVEFAEQQTAGFVFRGPFAAPGANPSGRVPPGIVRDPEVESVGDPANVRAKPEMVVTVLG